MKYDVIILAGGLGTRLRSVISDIPKPMAPVAGNPFLHYILESLVVDEIGKIVLSVGYKYEVIEEYIGTEYKGLSVEYAVEKEPLGTGGGIQLALEKCEAEQVLILNGDTFFGLNVKTLLNSHLAKKNDLTIGIKHIVKPYRYGTVICSEFHNRILSFKEKDESIPEAYINAGVYMLNRSIMEEFPKTEKWSFEKDFLEVKLEELTIASFPSAARFIDIGIPEDFEKAQILFKNHPQKTDWSNYTLLLDRDGVINKPKADDYVKSPIEFEFTENALEALHILSSNFKRIIIVTNQQGIDREIMSQEDLENVHLKMYKSLKYNNIAYFDAVFFAPYLRSANHAWRKPSTGMAEMAKTYYPDIDWNYCLLVGDSPGDMELADALSVHKIRIQNPQFEFDNQDMMFSSLFDFAQFITQN